MALSGAFDLQWEIHVCLNMKLDFVFWIASLHQEN